MRKFIFMILLGGLAMASVGCDLPRDPEGTSDEVNGGELIVGRIAGRDPIPGEDAVLVAAAAHYSAKLQAVQGDLHYLVQELKHGRIHVISGALPEDTPFAPEIGMTKPIHEGETGRSTYVFAIRKGENAFLKSFNTVIAETVPQ